MALSARSLDAWELFDPRLAPNNGDLNGYLKSVLDRCARWFEASGASVFLIEEEDVFKLAANVGEDASIPAEARVIRGVGVAGASIDQGKPLIVKDPRTDPSLGGKVATVRREIGSSMVIPLLLPDQGCVGVLNLSRHTGSEDFSRSDLQKASAVAHQLALAVGNARLLADKHAAHDLLKTVIDTLSVGVLVIDSMGQIVQSNPEGRRILSHAGGSDWLAEMLGPNGPCRRRCTHDGRAYWVLRETSGAGTVLTVHDVTEQEQEQQEGARLRRLAEIGQMTAAIAHEIRNPLTGIRSAAQLIPEAPERATEFAELIEEEVVKLNGLCEEFLEFARPMQVREGIVNLAEVATRVSETMLPEFVTSRVNLQVKVEGDTPMISGDALRLEQVMRNLLRNALHACASQGEALLTVGDHWFEVTDTGCGMAPETVERLFIPFFTTKPKGTGLGLSNVRKIVEAHRGTIDVKSELGKGSSFRVSLPTIEER